MKVFKEGAKCWKDLAWGAFACAPAKGKGKGKRKGQCKGWHNGLWNPFFATPDGGPQQSAHIEANLVEMLANQMRQHSEEWSPAPWSAARDPMQGSSDPALGQIWSTSACSRGSAANEGCSANEGLQPQLQQQQQQQQHERQTQKEQ